MDSIGLWSNWPKLVETLTMVANILMHHYSGSCIINIHYHTDPCIGVHCCARKIEKRDGILQPINDGRTLDIQAIRSCAAACENRVLHYILGYPEKPAAFDILFVPAGFHRHTHGY